MKKSSRAALLSMFILPGAGHFYLKKYWRGFLITLIVMSCLAFIIWSATITALHYLEGAAGTIQDGTAGMSEISKIAGQTSTSNPYNDAVLYILVIVWIFAVIDAYRIGKKMHDQEEEHL